MGIIGSILLLIQRHLFLFFLIPQLVLIGYVMYNKNGFDDCYSDRTVAQRKGVSSLFSPYNFTLVISVALIVITSVRKVEGKFVVMMNVVNNFLNGYMFHRSLYFISGILKENIGDTNCSVNNAKPNGISGHFFTAIFFFALFVHLLRKLTFQPKHSNLLCFEFCEQKNNQTFFKTVQELFCIDDLPNTKHILLGKGGLLIYLFTCLLTMGDTLLRGYHTPRQVFYGILFGIVSIILYTLFIKTPFKYQSLTNMIMIIASYLTFCQIHYHHFKFTGFFITGVISILLTHYSILSQTSCSKEE
ncbi:hypothetical protein ENUP19_0265G0033 [Entamoeba nuttalli]